jgi:hypothetical protein
VLLPLSKDVRLGLESLGNLKAWRVVLDLNGELRGI